MRYQLICALVGAALLLTGMPVFGAEPTTQPSANPPALNVFAVGDWGIDSPDRQTVADAMAKQASSHPAQAPAEVLLLGDNYYVKLSGMDDPQIQKFFEQTYDPKILNIPFYAVFGNHDYTNHDDPIELGYSARGHTRFTMPSRWYRLDLPQDHPLATFLMLDSDQPYMSADTWKAETKWLGDELAKPHAQWLICCAHHDMFGNGSHGDNGVLQNTWGPLFKQYHVDFYICGHEHTLQHLEIPGCSTSFVIAGGGGAERKGMLRDVRGPFSRASLGFADIHIEPTLATISLIDGSDSVVHSFTRTNDGKVQIVFNSPSDKASQHPLQVIDGIDGATAGSKSKGGD